MIYGVHLASLSQWTICSRGYYNRKVVVALSLYLIALSPQSPSSLYHLLPPPFHPPLLKAGCFLSPSQPLLLPTWPCSLFSIYFTLTFSFDPFMFYRPLVSVLRLGFSLGYVLQFQITRNIRCISQFPCLSHKSRKKIKVNYLSARVKPYSCS